MAKDNTLMYALMAVGGYFVYTYLRDTGALVEFGIAPALLPQSPAIPAVTVDGQQGGKVTVDGGIAPPPPAPTLESNLRARIINLSSADWTTAGTALRLNFWQWGHYYEQATNGERSADPFTLPAFQGKSVPEVEAQLLTYDEWAGYMSQAGYTGLSGRGYRGMGAATYGGTPQGWTNGHDAASPWGQTVSGWGGQFNRG